MWIRNRIFIIFSSTFLDFAFIDIIFQKYAQNDIFKRNIHTNKDYSRIFHMMHNIFVVNDLNSGLKWNTENLCILIFFGAIPLDNRNNIFETVSKMYSLFCVIHLLVSMGQWYIRCMFGKCRFTLPLLYFKMIRFEMKKNNSVTRSLKKEHSKEVKTNSRQRHKKWS